MVYVGTTAKYVFVMHPGDVFWCTADCGWVTGHSYLTYGEGPSSASESLSLASFLSGSGWPPGVRVLAWTHVETSIKLKCLSQPPLPCLSVLRVPPS